MENLPPLNALRSFVTAGSCLSFTKAARELNVTQAAVSQQVRLLEQNLGTVLFVRQNNSLQLTETGARLLPQFQMALSTIGALAEMTRSRRPAGIVRVSTLPGFGQHWLIPRLKDFCDQNPDIEIHLTTSRRTSEFPYGDADLAVRLGKHWPEMDTTFLMRAEITPVCSPLLLRNGGGLRKPEHVLNYTLIHSTTDPDDWEKWLAAANVHSDDINRGPRFDSFSLAIEAAASGLGIAVVRRALVTEELATGRLVAPFPLHVRIPESWHLIHPPGNDARSETRRFKDWIVQTAAHTR